MVKRIGALLAVMLLLPLWALGSSQRVFDDSDLFTPAEETELEALITQLKEKYPQMDFAVLTSDDARYNADDDAAERNSLLFADDFYVRQKLGAGEEESGILVFIDMANRMPTVYTYGAMIDYVTDSRLETLLDTMHTYLAMGNYAGAASKALDLAGSYVRQGIPEGQYRYDYVTGQVLTARHKALTRNEILVGAAVGMGIGLIVVLGINRSYKLKGGAYTYDAQGNNVTEMLDSKDEYLTSTVSSVRRSTSSGSSGGSGRSSGGTRIHSSGGRSFGGGSGRRF